METDNPITLAFATGNRAKLAQFAYVIAALNAPVQIVSAKEKYGDAASYVENGGSATAIAQRGAMALVEQLGIPIIVEDTTFEVDALDGQPGVRAGDYLKEHGREGILKALGDRSGRTARITSALVWATPAGEMQTWVNVVNGHVTHREWYVGDMPDWVGPSPDNPLGGGYNAIFVPRGNTRTLAEIAPDEAMHWGYREPNFAALLTFLKEREWNINSG